MSAEDYFIFPVDDDEYDHATNFEDSYNPWASKKENKEINYISYREQEEYFIEDDRPF